MWIWSQCREDIRYPMIRDYVSTRLSQRILLVKWISWIQKSKAFWCKCLLHYPPAEEDQAPLGFWEVLSLVICLFFFTSTAISATSVGSDWGWDKTLLKAPFSSVGQVWRVHGISGGCGQFIVQGWEVLYDSLLLCGILQMGSELIWMRCQSKCQDLFLERSITFTIREVESCWELFG